MNNWMAWGVVVLQSGAGVWWIARGPRLHGVLWLMYAATNLVLMLMASAANQRGT